MVAVGSCGSRSRGGEPPAKKSRAAEPPLTLLLLPLPLLPAGKLPPDGGIGIRLLRPAAASASSRLLLYCEAT